jgi:hypothetical protein
MREWFRHRYKNKCSNMSNNAQRVGMDYAQIDVIAALPVAPSGNRESGSTPSPLSLRFTMDRYIHDQNLAHYRKVLAETTDPTKRETVLKLIADEQAKVRAPTATK